MCVQNYLTCSMILRWWAICKNVDGMENFIYGPLMYWNKTFLLKCIISQISEVFVGLSVFILKNVLKQINHWKKKCGWMWLNCLNMAKYGKIFNESIIWISSFSKHTNRNVYLHHYHFEFYPFEEYGSCTTYVFIIPVAFLSVAPNTFLYWTCLKLLHLSLRTWW